mgnify:CR=1 FL=1
MDESKLLRIGIIRPASASEDRTIAEAESRVVRNELERRLGLVGLDLRNDGPGIGAWLPLATAAWPDSIDIMLESADLWSDDRPPLTALFGRTVAPEAAEVRARMLEHLGVLPVEPAPLDADRLAVLRSFALRPTDLWLVAQHATEVNVDEPAVSAFAESPGSHACEVLATAFDTLAEAVRSSHPERERSSAQQISRLIAERGDLHRQVTQLDLDRQRLTSEANDAIAQLRAELRVMSDRLERAELESALASRDENAP